MRALFSVIKATVQAMVEVGEFKLAFSGGTRHMWSTMHFLGTRQPRYAATRKPKPSPGTPQPRGSAQVPCRPFQRFRTPHDSLGLDDAEDWRSKEG